MDDVRPTRIRLSRAKGWRMPEGAVKVDRSTLWGNPFLVGRDGDAAQCVQLHTKLLAGLICLNAAPSPDQQRAYRQYVSDHVHELAGKSLACWCRLGAPCHADTLLAVAAKMAQLRKADA